MNPARLVTAAFAALVATTSGCVVGSQVRYAPASHFVYPNSNMYVAHEAVHVEHTSDLSLWVPQGIRTPDDDVALYDKALKEVVGAEMIVDYVVTSTLKIIPIPYLFMYYTTYELEGFPARIEQLGDQELE